MTVHASGPGASASGSTPTTTAGTAPTAGVGGSNSANKASYDAEVSTSIMSSLLNGMVASTSDADNVSRGRASDEEGDSVNASYVIEGTDQAADDQSGSQGEKGGSLGQSDDSGSSVTYASTVSSSAADLAELMAKNNQSAYAGAEAGMQQSLDGIETANTGNLAALSMSVDSAEEAKKAAIDSATGAMTAAAVGGTVALGSTVYAARSSGTFAGSKESKSAYQTQSEFQTSNAALNRPEPAPPVGNSTGDAATSAQPSAKPAVEPARQTDVQKAADVKELRDTGRLKKGESGGIAIEESPAQYEARVNKAADGLTPADKVTAKNQSADGLRQADTRVGSIEGNMAANKMIATSGGQALSGIASSTADMEAAKKTQEATEDKAIADSLASTASSGQTLQSQGAAISSTAQALGDSSKLIAASVVNK